MSEGLERTKRLLATTRNLAAVDVLLTAIDAPEPRVRFATVEALLERKNLKGQLAILRRLPTLNDQMRQKVVSAAPTLDRALRTALVDEDLELREAACELIRSLGEPDFIPLIIGGLESPDNPMAETLAATLFALLASLASPADETAQDRGQAAAARRAALRGRTLRTLEGAVERFPHHRREELIEAFLMLARPTNPLVHTLFGKKDHACYQAAVHTMATSGREEVWRLLLGLLDQKHPPAGAAVVLAQREDVPFVRFLARNLGDEISNRTAQTLGRLEAIAWFTPKHAALRALDQDSLRGALRLLARCGLNRQQRFDVLASLAESGRSAARRVALEELSRLTGEDVNRLLLGYLDDPDPGVQATATVNLRSRSIAGSLGLLLAKLDSPHEVVRQAARDALNEYRFPRFLSVFDQLNEASSRRAGRLIKKIDPDTVPLLRAEFESPSRSHRLRALRVAEAVELVDEVESKLIDLLRDETEDGMVRTEAARLLAGSNSAGAFAALERALGISNPRVRSQAELSLAQIRGRRETTEDTSPASVR